MYQAHANRHAQTQTYTRINMRVWSLLGDAFALTIQRGGGDRACTGKFPRGGGGGVRRP